MQSGKRSASWSVLLLIVMLALAAGTKGLAGQRVGESSSPAITAAVDSRWPDVDLNAVVLDKEGVPQKVDERKFQLFENGSERPLQVQGLPNSPVSVALLVDSSGSIFKRKDTILAAVKAIVKGLPVGSEVAVMDFNSVAYIDVPFTAVSKIDFASVDRLGDHGPTALYDAVVATEDYMIAHARYARRALVVLSDGQDNASHTSIKNTYWKMEQPGAPVVYACLTSNANIMQSELMAGYIKMRALAKNGGGIVFHLYPDPASAAAQITDAIRNQFVLQFTAANSARDGKARKLKVRLPIKDVKIYALPEYFAPAK